MMTKADRLRAQMRENLLAAKDIAAKAENERRDFTGEERNAVEHFMDEAKRIQPLLAEAKAEEQKANDRKVSNWIKEFADATDGPAGTVGASQGNPRLKSLGGSTWGSEIVRQHSDHFGRLKALSPSGTVMVSVPLATQPVRESEPVLALRQLIPSEKDTVGVWAYMRQILRDNNAKVVPRGAKKPTSRYTLERREGRSGTVAHLTEPIARQDLADAPMLTTFVDTELRLGLEEALEDEVVNGTGIGDRPTGLNFTSGTQSQAWATDLLTTTRQAVTKLEVLSLNGSGWLLHPVDWQNIELAANANGYLLTQAGQALPVDRAARRLWSLPVTLSTSVAVGTGWLADFAGSTVLKVREDASITWSENTHEKDLFGEGEDGNLFEANMIRFRCEGRFGFAVTRPAGIVKLDLSA
ncbi:phage major capsid protein [Amycolatopsis sp. cmx-11-32]|uniref:phage major capsid protein n=1 Tax=Amycolatopsis sp. cmx-11-32 TaxID=2785796 RepID=UPI0039E524F6